MECGKVKSNGTPIFYFVLDPVTPDAPDHTRVRQYYVVSHVDSYVEAFYFIARHFATPSGTLDAAIARWHALYAKVFGTVSAENFRKSLMSVPVEHFHLTTSEEAAREKATASLHASSMHAPQPKTKSPPRKASLDATLSASYADAADRRWDPSAILSERPDYSTAAFRTNDNSVLVGETAEAKRLFANHTQKHHHSRIVSFAAPPSRLAESNLNASHLGGGILTNNAPLQEDARVELHRLKAELADASHVINVERSRAKVNALSDAERSALLYQIDIARKEANEDKAHAREASERLRQMSKGLEERLQQLTAKHEETLRAKAAAEYERLNEVEQKFLEREKAMQAEYEQAIHERDRKLARAVSRVKAFETHLDDALNRIEEQKVKLQEMNMKVAESTNQATTLEEENRRLKRQIHGMEMQLDESNRSVSVAEDEQRKAENEAATLRIEVARLRREMERYSQFSHSLHRELQQLDDSAITAAELLRRKVFANRHEGDHTASAEVFSRY